MAQLRLQCDGFVHGVCTSSKHARHPRDENETSQEADQPRWEVDPAPKSDEQIPPSKRAGEMMPRWLRFGQGPGSLGGALHDAGAHARGPSLRLPRILDAEIDLAHGGTTEDSF